MHTSAVAAPVAEDGKAVLHVRPDLSDEKHGVLAQVSTGQHDTTEKRRKVGTIDRVRLAGGKYEAKHIHGLGLQAACQGTGMVADFLNHSHDSFAGRRASCRMPSPHHE